MSKERERIATRSNRSGSHGTERYPEWRTPRGDDVREVARDATGQVLERYSEALRKLKSS